ncbi:hypothetical protein CPC08DRAFT_131402 [Agrocybe pediades]|nr:hypothetical protein CPC08DRAFT_131402 [Agrocybe pediades]
MSPCPLHTGSTSKHYATHTYHKQAPITIPDTPASTNVLKCTIPPLSSHESSLLSTYLLISVFFFVVVNVSLLGMRASFLLLLILRFCRAACMRACWIPLQTMCRFRHDSVPCSASYLAPIRTAAARSRRERNTYDNGPGLFSHCHVTSCIFLT